MLTLLHTNPYESVVQKSMARPADPSAVARQPSSAERKPERLASQYEVMSEAEIEQAADELLRESVAALGRDEYPFYSESWLRQLAARETSFPTGEEVDYEEPDYPPQACLRLLAQTPMQREWRAAIRLSIKGMTVREIAANLNTNSTEVSRWMRAGLARLAAAVMNLDEMLNQREAIRAVRREDIQRYHPRTERHCKAGQEACRKTGLCPYRWYLMYES